MPSYKLTYFNISGRGEPLRMLFALADVPFKDVRLSEQEWAALKPTSPLGNLPILSVDGFEIGQSQAIMRYLARQFGFDGSSESALISAVADSLCDQWCDLLNAILPWQAVAAGFPGFENGDKEAVYKSVFIPARDKHFSQFEKYLSKSSSGWLASSSSFTHADIFIGSGVEMLLRLVPDKDSLLSSFPLLAAHQKKFLALPKVAEHIANRPKDLRF